MVFQYISKIRLAIVPARKSPEIIRSIGNILLLLGGNHKQSAAVVVPTASHTGSKNPTSSFQESQSDILNPQCSHHSVSDFAPTESTASYGHGQVFPRLIRRGSRENRAPLSRILCHFCIFKVLDFFLRGSWFVSGVVCVLRAGDEGKGGKGRVFKCKR